MEQLPVDLEQLSLEDLKTQRQDLSNLLKYPEWGQYLNLVRMHMEGRKNIVAHTPCVDGNSIYQQEYTKGEISGLYLSITFPELLLEAFDNELTRRNFGTTEEEA